MVENLQLSWNELLVYGVIHSSEEQIYTLWLENLAKTTGNWIATTKRCVKKLMDSWLLQKVSKWYSTVSKWYQKVSKWYCEEIRKKYQNDTEKYQNDTKKYQNDTFKGKNEDIYINNINNNKLNNNKNISTSKFEEFWEAYPLKKWRRKAEERYKQAVKKWVSEDLLIQKAKEYAEECKVKWTETKYIKRPEGWLNGWRYEDTYITATPKQVRVEDRPYDFDKKPTLIRPKLPWITNLKKEY